MEQREKGYNTPEDWNKAIPRNWSNYRWLYANLVKYYNSGQPIEKLLDIGCGRAGFMDCCNHFGMEKSRLFGIEGEKESYDICTAKGYSISLIDLDTDKLPYADNSFDVVVCSQLIEHITHQAGTNLISEIYRILKKGGLLLIYSPSYFNLTGRTMPFHIYCWKPYELRDLMLKTGFSSTVTKISPMKWYDLKKYDEKWHFAKEKQKKSIFEKFLEYSVYALFLVTKNQRLLSQTSFAAYK
ncbi:MAG TPA: class I SAM-dependent methyltransferase [Bacteroidia bacterium]|jgi:SAM-dependent methyltransferase|nr:class I SAM-dependent methyltransferase [Bacteroidia bacterium]